MRYKLKVYSIWEYGKRLDSEGKPHQEDCLFPAFGRQSEYDRTFVLCDGMGGHDAGEVASSVVCEAIGQSVAVGNKDATDVFTDDDLARALEAAFDALDQNDSGAEKKMGTTMTFLRLHSRGATIAHIGDSRVYHIRPGETEKDTEILFVTEDHSLVNDLVKIGELTREEARHSRQKNVITRAMQPHMERRPKADIYHTVDIRQGDYFYMCSDGMLEQPEMEDGSVLRRIFSAQGGTDEVRVGILIGATDENSDNHTAFVIHVLDVTDVEDGQLRTVPEQFPGCVITKHIGVIEDTPCDEHKPIEMDVEEGNAPSEVIDVLEEIDEPERKERDICRSEHIGPARVLWAGVVAMRGVIPFLRRHFKGRSGRD